MKIACLAAVGLLVAGGGGHAANSLGRIYGFGFEKGNFVRNWSFEDRNDNWFVHDNSLTLTRYKPEFGAVSGSFVARFSIENNDLPENLDLLSEPIPVEPGETYTLSFFIRGTLQDNFEVWPSVQFFSGSGERIGPDIEGSFYPANTTAWIHRQRSFQVPSQCAFLKISLASFGFHGGTAAAADLYFDDVVLEKGGVATSREEVVENIAYTNDAGQVIQNIQKVPTGGGGGPSKYVVQTTTYDPARRPVKSFAPFVNTGSSAYDPDFDSKSSTYNNGQNGKGALGNRPFGMVEYFEEPGAQIKQAFAPADAWAASDKAMKGEQYFWDLSVPANIENPSTSAGERPFLLAWEKDVNGNYSLSWTNQKGEVVKRAFKAQSKVVVTHYEYFPNGQLKKALTPADNPSDEESQEFREVINYNANGEITSIYTKDRGLQKFWYNTLGNLRFSRHESQPANQYNFIDYDFLDRPIRMGTMQADHALFPNNPRAMQGESKIERQGFIYENLSEFQDRIGFPLSDIMPGITLGVNGRSRLVCDYHLNTEAPVASYSAKDKLVATFYNYNQYGEVVEAYKYIGPIRSPSKKIQKVSYTYDQQHRLLNMELRDNATSPNLLSRHEYTYDVLGRVKRISGPAQKDIARYEYYDWGGLKSVLLGGTGAGNGTLIEYNYHAQDWVKEIRATRIETGEVVFHQVLGYEEKSIPHAKVTNLLQSAFDGRITQQLYKFASDVANQGPVRLVNYQYDVLNRMITSDFQKSANSPPGINGSLEFLLDDLTLTNTEDMDSRMEYDDLGRITRNRTGVAQADEAVYSYQENSYRLDKVTGKLSGSGDRDASTPGNFKYDSRGRLSEDASKNLQIGYTWDGLPLEFGIDTENGGRLSQYNFYDAYGNRVSRLMVSRSDGEMSPGLEVAFIGRAENGEPGNLYAFSSLQTAYETTRDAVAAEIDHNLTDIRFYVVLDRGKTEFEEELDIETLHQADGSPVILTVEGLIKDSPRYLTLTEQIRGTMTSAVHDLNLLATGDHQLHEEYGENGELSESRSLVGIFGRGSMIGRITLQGYEFYVKNNLGSTMRVVSDDGNHVSGIANVADYRAYGEDADLVVSAEAMRQKFTGKEKEESGIYAFGTRWMDPQLGMFLTPDPGWQFFNPYSYTGGDPVNLIDPDGAMAVSPEGRGPQGPGGGHGPQGSGSGPSGPRPGTGGYQTSAGPLSGGGSYYFDAGANHMTIFQGGSLYGLPGYGQDDMTAGEGIRQAGAGPYGVLGGGPLGGYLGSGYAGGYGPGFPGAGGFGPQGNPAGGFTGGQSPSRSNAGGPDLSQNRGIQDYPASFASDMSFLFNAASGLMTGLTSETERDLARKGAQREAIRRDNMFSRSGHQKRAIRALTNDINRLNALQVKNLNAGRLLFRGSAAGALIFGALDVALAEGAYEKGLAATKSAFGFGIGTLGGFGGALIGSGLLGPGGGTFLGAAGGATLGAHYGAEFGGYLFEKAMGSGWQY